MCNLFLFKWIALAGALLFLAGTAPHPLCADPVVTAAQMESLKVRIDSLAVVQQTEKRNGRPIGELELMAARLKDSVALLRQELLQQKQAPPAPPTAGRPKLPALNLPSALGVVDTIVVGAGAVALLLVVIFLFFLVTTASRRRKKNRRAPENSDHDTSPPRRMDSAAHKAYAAHAHRAPPPPQTPVEPDERPVPRDMVPPRPAPQPTGPAAGQTSLNEQVLRAVRAGLDDKTIAQQFTIGIDQVALIRTMAAIK